MKTLNIYLMRHGKVDAAPGLHGQTDLKVKEAEQQQIAMAWKTKGYDVAGIISSPLSRCHDLAQILAEQQLLPMTTEDDLQEMDFGDFDGMPFDLLTEHWKKLDAFWQSPAHHSLPNAESLSTFSQRVSRAWSQIINDINDNLLFVTHGGVIRIILAHVLGVDWRNPQWYSTLAIGNASVTHITITIDDQIYASVRSIGVPLVED
ncbi:alpha-ribazole phosphatase [Vibrio parahaemolyticus]|uniref:alpha-ribazole phosphatase n=1 Tax=Vibrio parahaemolyticus TaxID=670 RepID=UPI000813D230|nr:alpha-ribazole phosphatase [Vibrio parahaemolyticus]EGQ8248306.1 alpha-ribazole phosphatase [Vibrio parahaemolyticus]EGQ8929439.1 alpha-ribazole phosphatase [Vibrio parahaemolyticus]EGQ8973865.1 alpha-ribazole phosphatase [Vibrio parahaemolyticus]EGQ8978315.1 alpha-ribazole phosphatase [Vibrio parahaemolyticus]EGQ8997868.1 alpha-ribazole phosphatase [Vibrio parahaemolyticus]